MSFVNVNTVPQFNFQINRLLSYGETACDKQEVVSAVRSIKTFADWNHIWITLAENAEIQKRYLHAANYYRMVEFFLRSDNSEKEIAYKNCIRNFYKGFDLELQILYEQHSVPFEGHMQHCLSLKAENAKGTVLV